MLFQKIVVTLPLHRETIIITCAMKNKTKTGILGVLVTLGLTLFCGLAYMLNGEEKDENEGGDE